MVHDGWKITILETGKQQQEDKYIKASKKLVQNVKAPYHHFRLRINSLKPE